MSAEWGRKCEYALVISITPDVCWTPVNGTMVAVPYTIIGRVDNAVDTDPKYLICGNPALTTKSRIPCVEGNEAGTGGGIMSGVNCGWCRPLEHSTTFKSSGDWLVREGDLFAMNCAGPEGPANTYGRLVIMNQVAAAPSVSIASETKSVVDPATGKTIVERFESTLNPDTGATTTMRERSVFDPKTGHMEVQRVEVTTDATGRRSYKASAGAFDPDTDSFAWKTSTGNVPTEANVDMDEVGLDGDGRLYLREDDESFVPSPELDDYDDIPDDDPDVLNDPDVIAAKEGETACRAELEATKSQLAWEGLKAAVDVAGIVDPTPACDLTGAAMALSDGEWVDAGLSVVSAVIPYGGDAIAKGFKGARVAKRVGTIQRALRRLDKLLAKWQHAVKEAKKAAKSKIKKGKAGKPSLPAKPVNPGDGGFAPDLKAVSAKKPKIDLHSPEQCRRKLTANLRKAIGDPPAHFKNYAAHHDLPVKFQKEFADAGLDINKAEYGRWVEHHVPGATNKHSNWSAEFNQEWERFFAGRNNDRATRQEILDKMNALRNDPRFQ